MCISGSYRDIALWTLSPHTGVRFFNTADPGLLLIGFSRHLLPSHNISSESQTLKNNRIWRPSEIPAHFCKKQIKKWATVRDLGRKRPALMSMFSGHVKGNHKTADRDGSHLWSLVINWPWSLLCPVISPWWRRWKGSAIHQHLWVNLSKPQQLGAAGAAADYQGGAPTAHVFISTSAYSHLDTEGYGWI